MGKSASAPPAPDYAAAAKETAAGNLQAAQVATAANRVNQVTPYGNLNYTQSGTDTQGNPLWTATMNLSPEQQQLYNQQTQTSLGLGNLQNQGLGYVQQMMNSPFSTSGLPSLQGSMTPADLQKLQGSANLSTIGNAEAQQRFNQNPNLQTGLENQGMAGWDKATNLMMERLRPQMERESSALEAQLANQGIMQGSEAYNRAKMQLGQKQNDMANQAALAGQQVQQNLFGQSLQAGQFGNAAQQQMYANQFGNVAQQNQAAQQDFANRMSAMGYNNQQIQQMYANQQAQQQANNALAQQQYANQLSNAQLANAARQQGFQELAYQRNEPINTLNAVRSGSQVTNPQFTSVPQQATTAGADLMGAAQGGYNAQLAAANAQNAARAGLTSGLFGLGGAGLMAYGMAASDIRMKENIKQIGFMNNGLPVYEYEYKPEFKNDAFAGHGKFIGVMAHEVEKVVPEAVIYREDGYRMVNYGALNG